MFRVKICGVTTVEDALAAAAAGADALGLNFFPASTRYVEPAQAQTIAAALPPHVCRVGVFVNATAETIRQIVAQVGLNMVQLHGDEPAAMLTELADVPVIRAFRPQGGLASVQAWLDQCAQGRLPAAVLVDAYEAGQYGGTGRVAEWSQLTSERDRLLGLPLVLAGGLTAENVAAAIEQVSPSAVDTASGVEAAPGRKAVDKMQRFVAAAEGAFEQRAGNR